MPQKEATNKMIHSAQNIEVFATVGIAAIAIFGLLAIIFLLTKGNNRFLRLHLRVPEDPVRDETHTHNVDGLASHQESTRSAELERLKDKLHKTEQELKLKDRQRLQEQEDQGQSYRASLQSKDEELRQVTKDKQDALDRLPQKDRQLQAIRTEKERIIQEQLQELNRLKGRLRRMEEELDKEREEKEEALRRLSAIMSSRLKDGNPNVVDLNDQNRPTKIGEKYSELYDNQWTNAYGALEPFFSDDEEHIIYILRQMLEHCFTQCRETATVQLVHFRQGIDSMAGNIASKSKTLTNDLMQRIKEERKAFALDCRPEFQYVWQTVTTNLSGCHDSVDFLQPSEEMKAYVEECLTLCWYMAIQDPPMAIVSDPGDNPNQLFRAYLTSGPYAKFVVWPALLLSDQGSLVLKGTAEFTKQQ